MPSFKDKVLDIVKNIPVGKVKTYGQVAEEAGYPRAARAVANLMAKNYNPDVLCHRVIRADGSVGDYNRGGEKRKRAILEAEGVNIEDI